jgi:hypothetical protein
VTRAPLVDVLTTVRPMMTRLLLRCERRSIQERNGKVPASSHEQYRPRCRTMPHTPLSWVWKTHAPVRPIYPLILGSARIDTSYWLPFRPS